MIPDSEKTYMMTQENYLKLWRLVHEHESSINTLFSGYEKLKKMNRNLNEAIRTLKEYERKHK